MAPPMKRGLMVALMNNLFEVLKNQLQKYISLFDGQWNIWKPVLDLYRRLRNDDSINLNEWIALQRDKLLPCLCCSNYDIAIILCTLWSVYRTFSWWDAYNDWRKMRTYEYIIIPEASEFFELDHFIFFNSIAFSSEPSEERWPHVCVVDDTCQQPPNNRVQCPALFNHTKNSSLLESKTPK